LLMAGLLWEKSTTGWLLISQTNRAPACSRRRIPAWSAAIPTSPAELITKNEEHIQPSQNHTSSSHVLWQSSQKKEEHTTNWNKNLSHNHMSLISFSNLIHSHMSSISFSNLVQHQFHSLWKKEKKLVDVAGGWALSHPEISNFRMWIERIIK
jgi:hypothetical protein